MLSRDRHMHCFMCNAQPKVWWTVAGEESCRDVSEQLSGRKQAGTMGQRDRWEQGSPKFRRLRYALNFTNSRCSVVLSNRHGDCSWKSESHGGRGSLVLFNMEQHSLVNPPQATGSPPLTFLLALIGQYPPTY